MHVPLKTAPPRRSRLVSVAALMLLTAGVLPLVVRLLELDRNSFLLSGVVGVRPWAIAAAIAAIPFTMASKRSFLTFLAVVAIAGHLYWSMPSLTRPGPEAGAAGPDLSVMAANLLLNTDNLAPLAEDLAADPPDVLLLMEMTHEHVAQLAPTLDTVYDHRIIEPTDGVSGIGLWSAFPLEKAQIETMVAGGWPSVRATLDVDGEPVQVVGIHPPPPGSRQDRRIQQTELSIIARMPRDIPTVVMGDFNSTTEHAVMREFMHETGLRDVHIEAGPLVPATWPNPIPLLHIDHILVTDDLAIESASIPAIRWGSDHRAVAAELSLGR